MTCISCEPDKRANERKYRNGLHNNPDADEDVDRTAAGNRFPGRHGRSSEFILLHGFLFSLAPVRPAAPF